MSFQREGSNRAPAVPSRLRRHAAGNRAFPVQTTSKVAAQWRQAYTRPGAPQPFMALIHVDTNVKICRDMPAKGIHVRRDTLLSIAYSEERIPPRFQPPFRARTDTMGLWAKSVVIFNSLREHGKQSIRSLADRIGLSKSSVHRHLQAIDRRDRYPESSFWETKAGRT
jgi:DNA-binding transcriptional ArsR family regulator